MLDFGLVSLIRQKVKHVNVCLHTHWCKKYVNVQTYAFDFGIQIICLLKNYNGDENRLGFRFSNKSGVRFAAF